MGFGELKTALGGGLWLDLGGLLVMGFGKALEEGFWCGLGGSDGWSDGGWSDWGGLTGVGRAPENPR